MGALFSEGKQEAAELCDGLFAVAIGFLGLEVFEELGDGVEVADGESIGKEAVAGKEESGGVRWVSRGEWEAGSLVEEGPVGGEGGVGFGQRHVFFRRDSQDGLKAVRSFFVRDLTGGDDHRRHRPASRCKDRHQRQGQGNTGRGRLASGKR